MAKDSRSSGKGSSRPAAEAPSPSPAAAAAPPPPAPPEDNGGAGVGLAPRLLAAVAAGVGLFASLRLTWHHLDVKYGEAATDAFCQMSEEFNCNVIINSDFSEIKGIPVSLVTTVTYVVMLALLGVASAGGALRRAAMSYVFGLSVLAVFSSAFLAFISATKLGAFCPYCMVLYGANLALLVGALWGTGGGPIGASRLTLASLARPGLLLGSAGGWALALAIGTAAYHGARDGLIRATIERQEAQRKELEAKGYKFPTVTADDPFVGPADARVTLIEFADFQCGYCKRLSYELARVKEAYKDQVKFVFKNYPMNKACNPYIRNDRHPFACASAVAGECARIQGKFWEFHDIAFKNNDALEDADLKHYAEQIGLDMQAFEACRRDPATMDLLKADMDDAKRLGIEGTPRTYIEGEELKGVLPAEVLSQRLARALGEVDARVQRDQQELAQAREQVKTAPTEVSVQVEGLSFTMDAFEASIDAEGKAVSGPGLAPSTHVSWYDAGAACQKAGKRLCTAEEWLAACAAARPVDNDGNGNLADDYVEGNEYPYGDVFRQGFCAVDGDQDAARPVFTGGFPLCRTPSGVYDLTGNVAEWVGGSEDGAMLLGGGYFFEDKAKCQKDQSNFGPGWAHRYSGFRCCK